MTAGLVPAPLVQLAPGSAGRCEVASAPAVRCQRSRSTGKASTGAGRTTSRLFWRTTSIQPRPMPRPRTRHFAHVRPRDSGPSKDPGDDEALVLEDQLRAQLPNPVRAVDDGPRRLEDPQDRVLARPRRHRRPLSRQAQPPAGLPATPRRSPRNRLGRRPRQLAGAECATGPVTSGVGAAHVAHPPRNRRAAEATNGSTRRSVIPPGGRTGERQAPGKVT